MQKAPEWMLPQRLIWIAAADNGRDALAWGKEVLSQHCVSHKNQHRGYFATKHPHLGLQSSRFCSNNLFLSSSAAGSC